MQRFQPIVVAACLMVLLVTNTSGAGPWCGSDATLIYRLWNYTQADSDWWPSADLVILSPLLTPEISHFCNGHG